MALANVLEIPKEKIHKTEFGRIREREGGRFQIQYTDAHGKRRTQTLSTLAKAEKELRTQSGMKEKGITQEMDSDNRARVSALAESYKLYAKNSAPKSYEWIETVWRLHLEPFFGHLNAGRVGADEIERYRARRLGAGASPSTVNRETTILHATFSYALKTDKITRLPKFPARLAEPPPRKGFLKPEEYAALQKACRYAWLRGMMAVAYNFGFRKSELLGLKVSQVDLKAKTLRLHTGETKSGEGRTVVMTADVLALISECVKDKQPGDSVFTWPSGKPVMDYRRTWETMCEAAGVEILLHDFRRTASRNLIRAGVSRDVARKITGHKTDSIFSRYNITDENDLAEAARKLEIAAEVQQKLANVEK
jgi:integrase